MPDLGGLVNGLVGGQGAGGMGSMMPYMYMDGGDMFDGMEDMYKYGMGMPMMQGMGMGGQRQKSRRLRMPRHNRLLSKPHMKKRMLRKPREFYLPFLMGMMNQAQQNPQGTAQSAMNTMLPFFGYDGMDSEDRAAALMMGANPNSLPPPMDGIDGEDLWMYAIPVTTHSDDPLTLVLQALKVILLHLDLPPPPTLNLNFLGGSSTHDYKDSAP